MQRHQLVPRSIRHGALLAALLLTFGCTGGGGGTTASTTTSSTTTTTTSSTNPFAGLATISGTIDTASLSTADTTLLGKPLAGKLAKSSKAYKQAYAAEFTQDAAVKLYVVGADGSLEDTDLTGTLTTAADGTVSFSFPDVKDGINYVVRYVKLVGTDQALELKTSAYVPSGATAPTDTVTVSPKTTVVVETLVAAIINATTGTGISQDIVNNIISAVKTAIEALVASGAIQVPSMIVEASGSTIADIASTAATTNDDVANASGLLLSDTSVTAELDTAKVATQATLFDLSSVTTDAAKQALVDRVFDELLEGDSVPSFMLDFFSDVYIADTTKTVGQMMDAIGAGLMFPPEVTAPAISKADAIAAFRDELSNIYSLMDKRTAGTLTSAEKLELAEVPPVILGLFAISERAQWSALSATTSLNVPQGIAMVIYVVDVYITQAFTDLQATYTATDSGGGAGTSVEQQKPVDFDPMLPGSLMDTLGFYQVYQNYAGVEIFDFWVHPGRAWIESTTGGGQEVDSLSVGTCMGDVASMVARFNPSLTTTAVDFSGATVTLTYPKAGGTTGSVTLVNEAGLMQGPGPDGGFGETCFVLDPWREATAGQDPSTMTGPVQLDPARIISDFVSGTYTITAVVDGATHTRSETRKVITGMTDATPTLVTPLGFPNWPGQGATQAEMDAFNTAMAAFNTSGPTRFSANVDTDANGVNDAAKVTLSWTAPTVTLPAGVKMGYHLDVGKGGCDQTGCTWEHVFSTHERNNMLFTTSFTLPVNLTKDDVRPYQLNLNVAFLDTTTGEELGQGGNAHAEFWVADPLDKTVTFTVTGTAVDGYSVVLLRETENPDSLTNRFTRTPVDEVAVVNGIYTLTPTIGDFLDYPKAWYNIVMFQDTDGSGGFSDGDQQMWPAPGQNVWFNTWGGTLRVGKDTCDSSNICTHSETTILGGETVSGPTFTATTSP